MLEEHYRLMNELIEEVRRLRLDVRGGQPNKDEADRPLNRDQAAAYLGVHPDTLYRWAVEEGRIAYSRLGDGSRAPIRFLRKDLDDFISKHRIGSVDDALVRRRLRAREN